MRGFLLGAIIGTVAGVLVAPRGGEETREILRARAETWQVDVMARLDQATTELEALRRDVTARLDDMRAQMAKYREQMSQRAEEVSQREIVPPESPPTASPEA